MLTAARGVVTGGTGGVLLLAAQSELAASRLGRNTREQIQGVETPECPLLLLY